MCGDHPIRSGSIACFATGVGTLHSSLPGLDPGFPASYQPAGQISALVACISTQERNPHRSTGTQSCRAKQFDSGSRSCLHCPSRMVRMDQWRLVQCHHDCPVRRRIQFSRFSETKFHPYNDQRLDPHIEEARTEWRWVQRFLIFRLEAIWILK